MNRVVVTAQMLQDHQRTGRPLELPRDALITPAARDWLREKAVPITWQDARPADGVAGSIPIVIDLASAPMRSLLIALERSVGSVETIDPSGKAGGLLPAVRKLCAAVSAGRASRGLIFADEGSVPLCLANKCRGIRAALGTSLPAVEHAVRQLAINVLVVEPSRVTMHQIRQMVDRFVRLRPGDSARAILEAVEAMEGPEAGRP